MKHFLRYLPALALLSCSASSAPDDRKVDPVNAVVGDQSFDSAFHRAPTRDDEDVLRIKTHLSFVEQQLRARDTSHLSEAQRHARVRMLDRLNAYWMNGVFPRNPEGTAHRVPRFVELADPDDANLSPRRVCAVGALAEPDLGVDAINAIGAKYEHHMIGQIDDRAFLDWAAASGLDTNELAMIQPSYNFMPRPIEETGELSAAHISGVLAMREGAVNQCVYDALSPRQAHPEQIVTNVVITTEGNLQDVFVTSSGTSGTSGTSGASNESIRSCVERVISATHFRHSSIPKRAAHTFRIVGPRRADGSLEPAYLPNALRRADAAVNRCAATTLRGDPLEDQDGFQERSSSVRVEVDANPEGFFRVKDVTVQQQASRNFNFATPPQTRACVVRAIESLAAPTFRGPSQSHTHFYAVGIGAVIHPSK